MPRPVIGPEIDRLIHLLAKLPGLGPRSARRVALFLLKKNTSLMRPLAQALTAAAESITACPTCGNLDTQSPCGICADPSRTDGALCIVEDVADLWAMERTGFKGRYHVLGGTLSALDGVGPNDLHIAGLVGRIRDGAITEAILALNATVDGQTTAHYIMDQLDGMDISVTQLAHGVPVGGELDYLDDGTLSAALKARRPF